MNGKDWKTADTLRTDKDNNTEGKSLEANDDEIRNAKHDADLAASCRGNSDCTKREKKTVDHWGIKKFES